MRWWPTNRRGALLDAPVTGVVRRQVFDMPPVSVWVTEHRLTERRCSCGVVTGGVAPAALTRRFGTVRGSSRSSSICMLVIYRTKDAVVATSSNRAVLWSVRRVALRHHSPPVLGALDEITAEHVQECTHLGEPVTGRRVGAEKVGASLCRRSH